MVYWYGRVGSFRISPHLSFFWRRSLWRDKVKFNKWDEHCETVLFYYCPRFRAEVTDYINRCRTCIAYKPEQLKPAGFRNLQPIISLTDDYYRSDRISSSVDTKLQVYSIRSRLSCKICVIVCVLAFSPQPYKELKNRLFCCLLFSSTFFAITKYIFESRIIYNATQSNWTSDQTYMELLFGKGCLSDSHCRQWRYWHDVLFYYFW